MNALRKWSNASWIVGNRTDHRLPMVYPGVPTRSLRPHAQFGVRVLRRLVVTAALRTEAGAPFTGRLVAGSLVIRCALGVGGIIYGKREGDGGTPAGRWRLLSGFYRSDRTGRPRSVFPFVALRRNHGWCDDPKSSLYNKPIFLPSRHRHERMWREDHLYDTLIILDYNMKPCRKGRGSAIFFHLASESLSATSGCVAISESDMRRLLPRLGRDAVMIIR